MTKEAFLNFCYWHHITYQQLLLIAEEKNVQEIPTIDEYVIYWNSYNEWNKKYNPYIQREAS